MTLEAQEIVAELEPESGWWKSETEETLTLSAQRMLDAGMPYDETLATLESVVGAVMSEYGE